MRQNLRYFRRNHFRHGRQTLGAEPQALGAQHQALKAEPLEAEPRYPEPQRERERERERERGGRERERERGGGGGGGVCVRARVCLQMSGLYKCMCVFERARASVGVCVRACVRACETERVRERGEGGQGG